MSFFLPVIRPPDKAIAGALNDYYDKLATSGVTVSVDPSPSDTMVITVGGADTPHAEEPQLPCSTVFAVTGGFVSYDLATSTLTIRVWIPDALGLAKATPDSPRANRIVLGGLEETSVEDAIKARIATIGDPTLLESWTDNQGSLPAPGRQALEDAYFDRFWDGDADIFVKGGTPLGRGDGSADTVTLTLAASFLKPNGQSVPIAPELIVESAQQGGPFKQLRFAGHPLLEAINQPITITFEPTFEIWDNTPSNRRFVPLDGATLKLYQKPAHHALGGVEALDELVPTSVPIGPTGSDGKVASFTASVPPRSPIYFEYETDGMTVGSRTFLANIRTPAHKARLHLDADRKNTKVYRARYELSRPYRTFVDELAENTDDEKYELDRGNMLASERTLPSDDFTVVDLGDWVDLGQWAGGLLSHTPADSRDFIRSIRDCEATFTADTLPGPSKTFTVLFEGDSWMNYPFAFDDVYGHLDTLIRTRLQDGITYNRIPLQHFGDRSDHMFVGGTGTTRQWDFTLEFLAEYDVDLIVASSGGNDMAEPGIGNRAAGRFAPYFTDGHFDPALAASSSALSAADKALATAQMQRSFAVLLRNHRWFTHLNGTTQLSTADLLAVLAPLFAKLPYHGNLGVASDGLDYVGRQVIDYFPSDPAQPGFADELALLDAVFDQTALIQRYVTVKANWQLLLEEAQTRSIPVVTHTYGYPLFNEEAVSYLGQGKQEVEGPWFFNRFKEAGILHTPIQKICLKHILDRFVTDVLVPLKAAYPQVLDYADTRNINSDTSRWRDEMHLRSKGFELVAEAIYEVIAPKFPSYLKSF